MVSVLFIGSSSGEFRALTRYYTFDPVGEPIDLNESTCLLDLEGEEANDPLLPPNSCMICLLGLLSGMLLLKVRLEFPLLLAVEFI